MNSGVKWEQSQHAGLHVIMNCSCSVRYAAMIPPFVGGRNRFKYAMCGSAFLGFKSPFSYFTKKLGQLRVQMRFEFNLNLLSSVISIIKWEAQVRCKLNFNFSPPHPCVEHI